MAAQLPIEGGQGRAATAPAPSVTPLLRLSILPPPIARPQLLHYTVAGAFAARQAPGRKGAAMQIGIIGLGRMGANIARRLHRAGHHCVVYNRTEKPVAELAAEGMTPAYGIADLVQKLDTPRAVWLMLPAGSITEGMVSAVSAVLSRGDILIDGGNTFFKDDIRRAKTLGAMGIAYVDVGTSGGIWGLERGYCMMIGGPKAAVDHLDPVFNALAPGYGTIARTPARGRGDPRPEKGYIHAGPAGAGHFVKMVHNGIEYGLMQAYAEGFDILRGRADEKLPESERYSLDIADIAEVWRRGSVISSWLLDLTAIALAEDPGLDRFTGEVEDSGEGRWTVEAAIEEAVPANVLAASLFARFRSRKAHTFGDKLLSAMRFKFGGHAEHPAAAPPKG
ncbi:MAG TPA: decarboxylating 6-phosphogluconate dehydrogenase [Methylocella sp.]|nr:decarboxylating 6-phosphogluconate dehydrogenase [Methylocella sp.]